MKKAIFLGIIIAAFLGSENAIALSRTRPAGETRLKIEREWKGYYCGYTKAARLVIKTLDQWKEIWEEINHLQLPRPELPKLDFEKKMVVAVFMGKRSSGGYEIEIIKVIKTEEEIVIEVKEKEPPPESLQTMAFTQPYHIVMIKNYSLPVRFQSP